MNIYIFSCINDRGLRNNVGYFPNTSLRDPSYGKIVDSCLSHEVKTLREELSEQIENVFTLQSQV